jgi:hypothetical protein
VAGSMAAFWALRRNLVAHGSGVLAVWPRLMNGSWLSGGPNDGSASEGSGSRLGVGSDSGEG